jgi:hypothetical protein
LSDHDGDGLVRRVAGDAGCGFDAQAVAVVDHNLYDELAARLTIPKLVGNHELMIIAGISSTQQLQLMALWKASRNATDGYSTRIRCRPPGRRLGRPSLGQPAQTLRQWISARLETDGRTLEGVAVRVAQRILGMTAAIWHNFHTGQPTARY